MGIDTPEQLKEQDSRNKEKYKETILNILKQPEINFEKISWEYNYSIEELKAFQFYTRWIIIENIKQYIQKINSEKRDINKTEIIDKIKTLLIYLPKDERQKILNTISEITKKFNTIRKYIDFEKWLYKNPKELLYAITWITNPRIIKKFRGEVTIKQCWPWIIFFINDEYCYNIIITWWKSRWWNGSYWTYFRKWSNITGLEWTLIVIKWDGKNRISNRMEKHDSQHMRNTYFMPKDELPITKAKDEIIAYLADWRWIFKESKVPETIESLLTQWWNEYQYWLEWKERENHKKHVIELLKYANDLIKLTKDKKTGLTKENVISMLCYTPVNWRKDLHFNIKNAINLHNEQNPLSHSNQEPFHLKEILYSILNKPKNLSNWIELWRSLNTKKEDVINEINSAESIEEIKHILNDLKYSHIPRWPNNKWWIEISSIIDEAITWTLPITSIPEEIRQKILNIVNKW